jgi:hypothetical protein
MDVAAAYLTAAALGICGESLPALHASLLRAIDQYVAAVGRAEVRQTLMSVPASMSVPCQGPHVVDSVSRLDALVRMQQDFGRHDFAAVRMRFDSLRVARASRRPGDIALDHIYQEAWLLAAMGDSSGAARYLDGPLTALTTLSSQLFDNVALPAALVRSMAMRAELAAAAGDRGTAKLFADRVIALWSGASPPLQPVVSRMREISKGGSIAARR